MSDGKDMSSCESELPDDRDEPESADAEGADRDEPSGYEPL
ncbi:hypothetical protein ACWCP8_38485 [Streptomyces sp. NPDC002206]